MAQAGFGDARAALRKQSIENEFSGIFLPAYAQDPVALRWKRCSHGNFVGGYHGHWTKLAVERPHSRGRQIKTDCLRVFGGIRIISSIEHQVRAEFFDGVLRSAILLQRREKHRKQKKSETDGSESPCVPETEGQHYQPGTRNAEQKAKRRPGARSRAQR